MATLKRIFVTHTTAYEKKADTDAAFLLIASTPGDDFVQEFPDLDYNERERGRTDTYEFNVEDHKEPVDSNTTLTMVMTTTTDGWLPKSILAIGETESGERIILGDHHEWEKGWFDRGSNSVGEDRHIISN